MISQIELSKLYSIISNAEQTFEQISKAFNKEFDIISRKKALTIIIILLKDNLLNISQRIISYFILYDTSQGIIMESNPFLFVILDRLNNSSDKIEQNFLIDFLYKKINYLNKTISQYIGENPKEMKINLMQIKIQWDKYYKDYLKQQNINKNSGDKMRPIIYDRKKVDNININNPNDYLLGNVNYRNDLNINYLKNDYFSVYPVNNGFLANEPIWLFPYLKHNFLWDKK